MYYDHEMNDRLTDAHDARSGMGVMACSLAETLED